MQNCKSPLHAHSVDTFRAIPSDAFTPSDGVTNCTICCNFGAIRVRIYEPIIWVIPIHTASRGRKWVLTLSLSNVLRRKKILWIQSLNRLTILQYRLITKCFSYESYGLNLQGVCLCLFVCVASVCGGSVDKQRYRCRLGERERERCISVRAA